MKHKVRRRRTRNSERLECYTRQGRDNITLPKVQQLVFSVLRPLQTAVKMALSQICHKATKYRKLCVHCPHTLRIQWSTNKMRHECARGSIWIRFSFIIILSQYKKSSFRPHSLKMGLTTEKHGKCQKEHFK